MKYKKIYSIFILSLFLISCGVKRSTSHRSFKTVEEKFAYLLGVEKEKITNKKLYSFIDEWYGVRYKYGGSTKSGIDCSNFASLLNKEVFGKEISGPSASMYKQCDHIVKEELHEGDLVFFKIDSKDISHIGVYLQNNKFVHATTKAGVRIDSLDDDYYKKYFEGAGRIR